MSLLLRNKILLILISSLLLFAALLFFCFLFIPPSQTSSAKVVSIRRGMSLSATSMMLEKEGLIRNKNLFTGMATLLGKKGKIKAGEYELNTGMVPFEVLYIIVRGQVRRHLVTIPEGYTLSQIARLLEGLGIVEKETILKTASSRDFILSLGLSHLLLDQDSVPPRNRVPLTLEGYLFPETYHFIKEMGPEEVIQAMVHQFNKAFGPELSERALQLGISQREAVILASIIEKETPLPEEKPLVSAVFHNRLRKKMPLQSDPTVIYGLPDFDGNLTREHLLRPTPYNTYRYIGLPPTAICNPGKDSLMAALHPAPVPYFYFVSKNDGSHHFSSDITDHQRAVLKYQKSLLRKN